MRIGFVLFNWFVYGGLQQDLLKILRACQGKAELSVYCQSWQGERLPGVDVQVVKTAGWTSTARRQQFADCIARQVKPEVDCLIGFNRMPALDYYFAADTCFAHKAYTERSWWYRQTPRARQYLAFEAAVFGNDSSATILMLSPLQREQYLQRYPQSAARIIDLPPGIDRKHQAGADAAQLRAGYRAELGIRDDELLVLQVGSSFGTKGVERSLQALAALPADIAGKVHYVEVGQDNDIAGWQARAATLTQLKSARFLGPFHDIPRCMQGADVLLHPSLYESAGLVLLEAVVAGLPVLTTAACGYACHVRDAHAGLVCATPFRQEQLNAHLATMLRSDRGEWRRNGIHYGQTQDLYDMPATVAALLLQHKVT
jgi:UDP-glucose:(heptosyl)LPS alpha-1,3-glucosyltransferase